MRAVPEGVGCDLLRSLSIFWVWSLVGAILWLLLVVLSFFTRDAMRSLQKRVRLSILFVLPAIAWEQSATWPAIKKGVTVAQAHWSEFIKNFGISDMIGQTLLVGFGLLVLLTSWSRTAQAQSVVQTTLGIVALLLIYICPFVLSFIIYIEQLTAAELYLWHLRWIKAMDLTVAQSRKPPRFEQIERPSLLNDIPELVGALAPVDKAEAANHPSVAKVQATNR